MSTPEDVLNVARSHLGYTEGPRNNETVFGARTGFNFQPWCGSFVDCVLQDAGLPVTKAGGPDSEPSSVYTPSGSSRYRALGRWVSRDGEPLPGDIVYFDWDGGQSTRAVDHVGIVESVLASGEVVCIEGNAQPNRVGDQSNGGGVYRRVRPRRVIVGFGRPLYTAAPGPAPTPETDWAAVRRYGAAVLLEQVRKLPTLSRGMRGGRVQTWQKALNYVTGTKLAEDGDFGPATTDATRSWQAFFKLEVDGVVGPKTRGVMQLALANIAAGKA